MTPLSSGLIDLRGIRTWTRASARPLIVRMREEEGLIFREIGERLGLSVSTVQDYYVDPDGSRAQARRDRHIERSRRPCVDCGTLIEGTHLDAQRCPPCAAQERTVWTPEAVVCAIQEWADIHGEPPAAPDWNPWSARHEIHDEARAQRFEDDACWPHQTSVVRAWGTWNKAIAAAGFTPRTPNGGGDNALRRRPHSATRHRDKVWTSERIIDALVAWRAAHGTWPASSDWRLASPEVHPAYLTVISRFGGWSAALEAATNSLLEELAA